MAPKQKKPKKTPEELAAEAAAAEAAAEEERQSKTRRVHHSILHWGHPVYTDTFTLLNTQRWR